MSVADAEIMELFQEEVEVQSSALVDGLLQMERGAADTSLLSALMRASHSLKGAARLVSMPAAEGIAHALEECFVAAQRGQLRLDAARVDVLLEAVDAIGKLARADGAQAPAPVDVDGIVQAVWSLAGRPAAASGPSIPASGAPAPATPQPIPAPPAPPADPRPLAGPAPSADPRPLAGPAPSGGAQASRVVEGPDPDPGADGEAEADERSLRVSAARLDSILGLAGEIEIAVRFLGQLRQELERMRMKRHAVNQAFDELRDAVIGRGGGEGALKRFQAIDDLLGSYSEEVRDRLEALGSYERRMTELARGMHEEVLRSRIRPFRDISKGLPRMIRELARDLGKRVEADIRGEDTPLDRDVLERLEAPLVQLIRNAVDHGLERPEERLARGKPETCRLSVVAEQRGGLFHVTVRDDGQGVDLDALRATVVERGLATADIAATFSQAELLEFLFLPSFSTRREVTQISGRGVGLDVVRSVVRGMRGSLKVVSQPGQGTSFELSLPVSLAVARTLLVDIGGERYAFPLSRVVRALVVTPEEVQHTHGAPQVAWGDSQVGLVSAREVLGLGPAEGWKVARSVVIIGSDRRPVGLVVDRFIGQRDLAVRRLDPRLGKVPDVSATALLEDGSPTLILDVDDLLRSASQLCAARTAAAPSREAGARPARRRVLVVEDSVTVRALESRILTNAGYEVVSAVDGAEGWNLVRRGAFDLLITDIDMPRMDGFELLTRVRDDAALRALPVIIVSYRDQPAHRERGLTLGADRYLTKGAFQNDAFMEAVRDLIGA